MLITKIITDNVCFSFVVVFADVMVFVEVHVQIYFNSLR